jgi:hypothetical protein
LEFTNVEDIGLFWHESIKVFIWKLLQLFLGHQKCFWFFLAEIKPVHAMRPLFRFSRVLKRANLLGEDLMNDLSLQSTDDLQNFRFRLNGMPDSFRFRVADKRDKRER